MTRHPGSAALAAFVTFGLFYAMNALSSLGTLPPMSPPTPVPDIVAPVPPPDLPPPATSLPPRPDLDLDLPVPGPVIEIVRFRPPRHEPTLTGPVGFPTPPVVDHPTDTESIRVFCPTPAYPSGQRASAGGWVHVAFDVDPAGRPMDVRTVDSEPAGVFDRVALRAASGCRYHPRRIDGEPAIDRDVAFVFRFEPERHSAPNKEETR